MALPDSMVTVGGGAKTNSLPDMLPLVSALGKWPKAMVTDESARRSIVNSDDLMSARMLCLLEQGGSTGLFHSQLGVKVCSVRLLRSQVMKLHCLACVASFPWYRFPRRWFYWYSQLQLHSSV